MDKFWIAILVLFLLNVWQSWLLFKKPTTENHIKSQKQKIKRNRGSNSSNDMSIKQEQEKPQDRRKQRKNGIFKRILTKRKDK